MKKLYFQTTNNLSQYFSFCSLHKEKSRKIIHILKIHYLLLAILSYITCNVSAQANSCRTDGKQNSIYGSLTVETVNSFKSRGMTMHAIDLSLGIYPIKHIGICGTIEHNTFHSRATQPKTYGNTVGFAGGLCSTLLNDQLEIKLQYGKDSGDDKFDNTFYDARLQYSPQKLRGKLFGVYVGTGVRYSKFKDPEIPNSYSPFISLGIGL